MIDFSPRLSKVEFAMRPALDEGDLQFLQLLHACREATIPELCKAAGVTATAIRQRLTRLQDLACIERITVRAGRGRPYYRYVLSSLGRSALGDNYAELAFLMWEEIQQIDNQEVRQQLIERLRTRFVKRFGAQVTGSTLEHRLEQLKAGLIQRGFRVEPAGQVGGELTIRESHCPYHDLAQADASICEFEQQVFETILGTPLELIQSCRTGANCCEFRVVSENSNEKTLASR